MVVCLHMTFIRTGFMRFQTVEVNVYLPREIA
jgi:hypothetical protein